MTSNLETKRILSYDDVAQYPAGGSAEQLVGVAAYDNGITALYSKTDMIPITGNTIYVRESIAKKLSRVETELRKQGYKLKVVYGYRHPDVQKKYFTERKSAVRQLHPELSGEALDRYTHNFVAEPSIAGHPAGAAVDLTVTKLDGTLVDMGTAIADYSDEDKIKTFADGLTQEQRVNRQLLHDRMVAEEFAPFYGEWWHFSYGDREWAAFYHKEALYGAIDFVV